MSKNPFKQNSLRIRKGLRISPDAPPSAPVNVALPILTGGITPGSILSLNNGIWTNSPTSFTYAWQKDGSPIGGQTASSYTTVIGDLGHTITGSVVATNAGGSSSAAVSNGITVSNNTPGTLSPGMAWNGTAGSGGSAPVDPPRTTAKPALQSYEPSFQRLHANKVFMFDADALGGVASVTVWLEGATQTVSRTVYQDSNVNGLPRQRTGFAVTVDIVGAAARHSTGAAMNMYAIATANDGTMQQRVIGPIVIYPRDSDIVWQKTVNPSGGGDYTNLLDAWTALRTAQPESAKITLTATGSYELGVAVAPGAWTGHTGYVALCVAPGVTATLIRGLAFDPLNTVDANGAHAWEWWPLTGPIEFRGSGVVLDMKNWFNVRCQTETPHWFNGCQIVNSIGTRDTLYWNLGPPPGFLVSSFSNRLGSPFTDGSSQYVDIGGAQFMSNWAAKDLIGGHGETRFISGCYETGTDPRFFTTPVNAISVTYNSTGVASIVLSTSDGGTLDCQVDGVSVGGGFPIFMGNNPSATYFHMTDVAAKINAISGGHWHATVLDNSRACWMLTQSDFTHTPINTTPNILSALVDFHTEWIHARTVGAENYLLKDNIIRRAYFSTSILNTEFSIKDGVARNNVWECSAQSFLNGSWAGEHVVMQNCYYDGPFPIYSGDAYSAITQSVFAGFGLGQGVSVLPTYPTLANNLTVTPWPAGTPGSNLTVATYAAFSALVTNKAIGDFRPATGPLTSNLFAFLDPYDARLNQRAANDAMGAMAIGYSAPSYPF